MSKSNISPFDHRIAAPGERRPGSQRVQDQTEDPGSYFVPAPQDIGATVQGRVSKDLKYLIAAMLASRETPFLTESDFIRSAASYLYSQIGPKLGGRFAVETRHYNDYVASMQRKAMLLDFEKFANAAQDVIVKLWAVGGKDEAADHYEGMLKMAGNIGESFCEFAKAWAKTNPRFKDVRAFVKARKASAAKEK